MELRTGLVSGIEIQTRELAGKPRYRIIPHAGIFVRTAGDRRFGTDLALTIAESLPDGEVKRAIINPEGYGFRGIRRLKHNPEKVGRNKPVYGYNKLIDTLGRFGVDKATETPRGGGWAIWMSFGSLEVPFSWACDPEKLENGFVIVMNASGLTDSHYDYKEEGVKAIVGHPAANLTYRERLTGIIEIEWPIWQSSITQG